MLLTNLLYFRKNIISYFDQVISNSETLFIHHGKDKGIVIMSLSEYNSIMTTQHELSSRKNQQRLDAAIKKMENKKTFLKDLLN